MITQLLTSLLGIGPKVTQSVITAAFLFAFKDALYNATVKARRTIAQKA
jgi:adenine nucleotide transporter 17